MYNVELLNHFWFFRTLSACLISLNVAIPVESNIFFFIFEIFLETNNLLFHQREF